MQRILLLLILFTSNVFISNAQNKFPGKISGKVVDPQNTAMEYVTVVVFKMGDSTPVNGTSTDSAGVFLIDNLPYNTYRVEISFLGFDKIKKDSVTIDEARPSYRFTRFIVLEDKSTQLGEIVIQENQDVVQYGIDKKIYNPAKEIVAKGGTATDVLQNIPSIQIDADRNLQFRGSGNITVYIDGKPSTLTGADRTAILDQIPAENIERVEIISNPSAKFDAEGSAGIINIITKKGKKDGYNALISTNIGSNDKYQANLLLNIKKGKFNVGMSYGFNQQHHWSTRKSHRSVETQNYDAFLNQDGNGFNKGINHTARFTVDYQPKNFQMISFSSGINVGNRDDLDRLDYLFYHTGSARDSSSFRQSSQIRESFNNDISLSYRKASLTPDKYLNADINYSRTGELENMKAFQPTYDGAGNLIRSIDRQNTRLDRDFNLWTFQVDKSDPLANKAKLETGLKTTLRNTDNDFLFERQDSSSEQFYSDAGYTNRFKYYEQVYAAYASYTKAHKRFGYSGGIRAEQTMIQSEQVTTGEKAKQNYLKFFPSAYLSYKITDKKEIQLNYSRRINRPGLGQLNPFANYSDPFNIQRGNPYLQPELTNSYEFNFVHQAKKYTFTTGVYWKNTFGQIIRFRSVSPEGVSTVSFENIDNSRSVGIEATFQYSPFKWWRINSNANFYQVNMQAGSLVAGLANNALGGNVRLSNSFTLKKGVDIQLTNSFMRPGWALQGTIEPFQATDIAIKKDILKGKGSVSFRVSDIFNQRAFIIATYGENFYQDNIWKRESRIAYLSLSYRFGNDKIAPVKKRAPSGGNEEMMEF